ncbi:Oidioi.mRNA.OKI2018_I69.PAR.g11533.t1.cds [Oikopleura dioica]|uniref:Oidioi.mRNA.OKI2018_I69.PAR.g11533.t1.cds n=1 Tax=Oikopleura dioica TaxID=34765 RepID=A0ABN7RZ67_OIKDI|nr:Oidioi.mRNA.OKI2018_I69.PAR.g11533.t1.cds [Oikopleura dioica]
MSYRKLQEEPYRNPVLASNVDYSRRKEIAVNMEDEEICRVMRWQKASSFHSKRDRAILSKRKSTDGRFQQSSSTKIDRLKEIHQKQCAAIRKESKKQRNAFIDDEAEDSDGGSSSDLSLHDSDLEFINDNESDSSVEVEATPPPLPRQLPVFDAASSSSSDEFTSSFEPVRNLAGLVPNVFDENTRVRVLKDSEVKKLPVCPTRGCLYTSSRKEYFDKHVKTCSGETKTWIRQSVQGSHVFDFKKELVSEGYLPSEDFCVDFYVVFDIECLMSVGPFTNCTLNENVSKFHNVSTIACLTSDCRQMGFTRRDMNYESSLVMITEFVNYLLSLKAELRRDHVPECVLTGIDFYSARIKSRLSMRINDGTTLASYGEMGEFRKKLQYLQSFMKLMVYSWCGETYDLTVIYPMLMAVFYEFCGQNTSKINVIKRGGGYMLTECMGLSFRDFRNYTAPMSLEKLARSCGLDPSRYSKGSYPYEWYTSIDQLSRATEFPAYICFYSSMYAKSRTPAEQMNKIICERVASNDWARNEDVLLDIFGFLRLDSLENDPALREFFQEENSMLVSDLGVNNATELCAHYFEQLEKIFAYSEEANCYQCDPDCEEAQEFFRFSIVDYEASLTLWREIEASNEHHRMTMLMFLMNYNFNDVRLLRAAIEAYSRMFVQSFNVSIHTDLSIAKIAQNIAMSMYQPKVPPIISIPPQMDFVYRDCRNKLSGGIVQVFHRAVYLNGPDEDVPVAAYTVPNGCTVLALILYDYTSLYPFAVKQFLPCGPGICYYPSDRLMELKRQLEAKTKNVETLEAGSKRTSSLIEDVSGSDNSDDDYDDISHCRKSVDDSEFRQRFSFNDFREVSGNLSRRYYSYGMFAQRENTNLDSIRYLEYLNWDPQREYSGRIQHAYNYQEKKIGRFSVDGYFESDTCIPGTNIPVCTIIEFNGCTIHWCPWCKTNPWRGRRIKEYCPVEKKRILKVLTLDELLARDNARMHEIVETIRARDKIVDPGQDTS